MADRFDREIQIRTVFLAGAAAAAFMAERRESFGWPEWTVAAAFVAGCLAAVVYDLAAFRRKEGAV
jgi:cytochrome c oxidase assembly factor CtaG